MNEYYLEFEENLGEYTGNITIITSDKISVIKSDERGGGVVKVGNSSFRLDEVITRVSEYKDGVFIDITDSVCDA